MVQQKMTHAQIIAQPSVETLLLDGGINVVAGIFILIIGWVVSVRVARWTQSALDRVHHFDDTLKPLIVSLARYAVFTAAIIAVLERFGIETTSLITLLGAAGLAVGLALQGTLSNVAAGVMLLLLRPFHVGDWITVTPSNHSGTVREIGLFTTILISADQAFISIPNSTIFSSIIVNSTREPLSRLNFTVAIDAASDSDAAMKIISETLAADRRILKVPPPATGVASLKEYSVELLVRCWVCNSDAETVTFDVQKEIRDRFRRAGIAIPARRQVTAPAREDAAIPQKPLLSKSG